ncbi:hypothetical protein H6F89_32805 [Cyanobacteria bacterium FACHB-63]|uniref:hypothetical protein n=1 Tax=Leptolyngbya sp. DQ-M1 TaxID=2933920 RepID=UPI0019C966C9|nr:hypothetical protein [Cyanobacteria bacterium FACHB-63]
MTEVYYLDHIIKAVSNSGGWQVHVIDSNLEPIQVCTSSAIYATAKEASDSGKEFVRRQAALSSMWEFLCECHESGRINAIELDTLSASLCFFCCFRDSYSPQNYWYR